ncbi:transcriptional regulator [Erysipelotrichaceae bacterium MTC7]|nr:transcriptional regulator [Erysipelotrichaceae bacterium MTC7]
MSVDFKKTEKELYTPPKKPTIINVPKMQFIAVRGKGDPNDPNGDYSLCIEALYAIAFTLKMSYMSDYKMEGYYKYVVPPLEGLWWQTDIKGFDYSRKDLFEYISLIRIPDFIKEEDVTWAIKTASKKKGKDFRNVEFFVYDEGMCVQCMHIGPYDDEPATIAKMDAFMKEEGYQLGISDTRHHHEIYLGDPRKAKPEKLRTVIRHPICKCL